MDHQNEENKKIPSQSKRKKSLTIITIAYFAIPLLIAIIWILLNPKIDRDTIFTFEFNLFVIAYIPCMLLLTIASILYNNSIKNKLISVVISIVLGTIVLAIWCNLCTLTARGIYNQYQKTEMYAMRRERESKAWVDKAFASSNINNDFTTFYERGEQDGDAYVEFYMSKDRKYIFTYALELGYTHEKGRTYHGRSSSANDYDPTKSIKKNLMTSITENIGVNGINSFTIYKYKDDRVYLKMTFDDGSVLWYDCYDFPKVFWDQETKK